MDKHVTAGFKKIRFYDGMQYFMMCFIIFLAFFSIQKPGFEHTNRPFGKISIEQRADTP